MTTTTRKQPRKPHDSKRPLPLYDSVAATLRQEIREGHQPGDKLESGPKLARRLGVSVLTVREAVNALTQEGLVERIRGSGTYVCQPTKGTVAILCGLVREDLRHRFFFLELMHHLESMLQAAGISSRQYFANLGRDEIGHAIKNPTFDQDLDAGLISAVVPVSIMLPDALHTRLAQRHIAIIGEDATQTDYATMLHDATGYLLAHGRRRLALLQPPGPEIAALFDALQQQAGIEPVPEWNCGGLALEDGDALHDAFVRMLQARPEMPDGLVCLNDVIFERFVPTLLELGIQVPARLMIVTHANKGSAIRIPFPVARMEVDPDQYADAVAAQVRAWATDSPPPEAPLIIRHRWIPEQFT